jgi:transcriptional regulator with XRE-family HTH domain
VAQPPNPRGPLGALIERYKRDLEIDWEPIQEAAGVQKTTLEQWLSGRTREPPLRAMLRIRRFLGIPFDEFEREALGLSEEQPVSGLLLASRA